MTICRPSAPGAPRLSLVGCGILRKEVEFLLKKNGWNVEPHFLASALHNYFDRLYNRLDQALAAEQELGRRTLVFYGACHPRMNKLLEKHHSPRTEGQNCIVMLLGYPRFMEELEKGAYFLLEDWALTWEPMMTECFGKNPEVIRDIFQGSHQYLAAIRTPCSGNFRVEAEAAAAMVDLPLVWLDADLGNLEQVLADALQRLETDSP